MFFRTRLQVTSTEVMERLVAWNLTVAPPEEHKKLVILARDGSELVGGVAGYTHWNWLFVSHLWVADGQRGGTCQGG